MEIRVDSLLLLVGKGNIRLREPLSNEGQQAAFFFCAHKRRVLLSIVSPAAVPVRIEAKRIGKIVVAEMWEFLLDVRDIAPDFFVLLYRPRSPLCDTCVFFLLRKECVQACFQICAAGEFVFKRTLRRAVLDSIRHDIQLIQSRSHTSRHLYRVDLRMRLDVHRLDIRVFYVDALFVFARREKKPDIIRQLLILGNVCLNFVAFFKDFAGLLFLLVQLIIRGKGHGCLVPVFLERISVEV